MAGDDKIQAKIEEGIGKAKESVGRATNNDRMTAEGRDEQEKARTKQEGDSVLDATKDAAGIAPPLNRT